MHVTAGSGRPYRWPFTAAAVLLASLVLVTAGAAMLSVRNESRAVHAAGSGAVYSTGAHPALPAGAGPAIAASNDRTIASVPTPVAETTRRRAFDHAVHESVSCTRCHGAGGEHRALLVRGPADCAACHHDDAAPRICSDCHALAGLPEPGHVILRLALGVWAAPQERELPFGHAVHGAVDCRECHQRPVTLAMERSCGSCHEAHHSAASDCAACHGPATARAEHVHGARVHLSCEGAGCHAGAVAPAPDLSRSLCIACHAPQVEHEPGEACARCHLLAAAGGAP